MKREMNCAECASSWADIIKPNSGPNEDGEGLVQVTGKCVMSGMCDGCGIALNAGDIGTATSLYSGQSPYFEWEDEYLDDIQESWATS